MMVVPNPIIPPSRPASNPKMPRPKLVRMMSIQYLRIKVSKLIELSDLLCRFYPISQCNHGFCGHGQKCRFTRQTPADAKSPTSDSTGTQLTTAKTHTHSLPTVSHCSLLSLQIFPPLSAVGGSSKFRQVDSW